MSSAGADDCGHIAANETGLAAGLLCPCLQGQVVHPAGHVHALCYCFSFKKPTPPWSWVPCHIPGGKIRAPEKKFTKRRGFFDALPNHLTSEPPRQYRCLVRSREVGTDRKCPNLPAVPQASKHWRRAWGSCVFRQGELQRKPEAGSGKRGLAVLLIVDSWSVICLCIGVNI